MSDLSLSLADPLKEANEPSSPVARFGPETPLAMDCGVRLDQWQIAYVLVGDLPPDHLSAVLGDLPKPDHTRLTASSTRPARTPSSFATP